MLALLAIAMLGACGLQAASGFDMNSSTPRQAIVAPVVHPTGPALPAQLPVAFSNLPPGTYQVHLHAICNGSQNYHLAYLPDLVVGDTHMGRITVPTADFGRGWCVIVYKNAARNIVLVTQPV